MACAWFLLPLCSLCVFFSSFRRPFSCTCVCARRKKRNEQRKGRREWEGEKHIELAHIQRKIFQPNKNKHFPMFTRMNFRSGFTSFFLFPDVEVIFCDNECFVFRFLFLVSFRSRIHVKIWHAQTTSSPLCTSVFENHGHINEISINVQLLLFVRFNLIFSFIDNYNLLYAFNYVTRSDFLFEVDSSHWVQCYIYKISYMRMAEHIICNQIIYSCDKWKMKSAARHSHRFFECIEKQRLLALTQTHPLMHMNMHILLEPSWNHITKKTH